MNDDPHLSPAAPIKINGWIHLNQNCARIVELDNTIESHVYQRANLCVISSRIFAEYQSEKHWQNHISLAILGHERRANDFELDIVRGDFDMEDAEEDNHSPGVARHLFLPLHLPRGVVGVCDCKNDEDQIVEPDGFRWSRTKILR